MTTGMEYKAMVDEDADHSHSQLLQSFEGLPLRSHNVTFSTHPTSPDATFNFDKAIVTLGTGLQDATIFTALVDHEDPLVRYKGFTHEPPGASGVPTFASGSGGSMYRASKTLGDTATLSFNGSAIVVYGPCFQECGAYTVTLDGSAKTYNGSITYTNPSKYSQNCLRYFAAGLDPAKQHTITVSNAEKDRVTALTSFQVIQITGGSPLGSVARRKLGAGEVAGSVLGALVGLILALLAFFIFWRKRRSRTSWHSKDSPNKITPFEAGPRIEHHAMSGSVTSLTPLHPTSNPTLSRSDTVQSSSSPAASTPQTIRPMARQNTSSFVYANRYEKGSMLSSPSSTEPSTDTASTLQRSSSTNPNPTEAGTDTVDLSQLSSDVTRILQTLNRIQLQSGQPSTDTSYQEDEGPPMYSER
jgi:LPXTG-motif cell wall-anchored protein